ncbi:pyrimidine-nucleoside phosphorylase [Virgibacillus sp. MSP4-1]|uniref:pyrimidine-nucleoside phosphorylase n=1 Tax=Virgibacillus sp. MSP4-1 TaxID=2700081 RepID=UPI00039D23A0|nr:pyrimidine-nucleoside phosphorylase [Virgibacillus sp. MSP4-1]QHS22644.1 pyrimidine-nucleoside phosphorylase [Virgibacillus sp. MSP4-1]
MRMYDVITKKRDGEALTKEEVDFFIEEYTNGTIPDYQASALCMAIFFQDMTEEERANLTMAMVNSGDTIDLSSIEGIKVDKHSTGGVGDTTTLVLAPLVASLGVPVAKMSGRGLGHTGGTIDKLESVSGFHVEMDKDKFIELVNQNKVSVIGQSGNLTPADKKLYGLRDVTATVNSIPLIASSIMSKKIAAGADAIVLDVKTGAGAFMKTEDESEELAKAMVSIGNQVGRRTMAVISDMNQPLGHAIGNALEVQEAIDTLKGEGPEDLTELCLTLGSQMAVLGNRAQTLDEAKSKLEQNIANGNALEKFRTFLESQGGDGKVVENPELLPRATHQIDLPARESGYVSGMTADEIGKAAMHLGAGRATKESEIDLAVGLMLNKKIGDYAEAGESLVTVHSNQENVEEIKEILYNNIQIQKDPVNKPELVRNIIE